MSGNKNTLGRLLLLLLSKRIDMVSLVRTCSGNPCFGRVFDALVQHGNYQSNYISTTGSGDQDRRQRIFGSRVMKAVRAVLENNDSLFQCLVKDAGISIRDIYMSPDNSKAYILWDTYKEDDVDGAEKLLKEHMPELKRLVSKKLGAKRVPYLECIGHHQTSVQQSKSDYERLQRELDKIAS